MKTAGILLAAGSGKRMGGSCKKQYMMLQGYPLLYYPLMVMEKSFLDEIILVIGEDDEERIREDFLERYPFEKAVKTVIGGKERYHSVAKGLEAVSADCDYCFIHDGARIFLNQDILNRALTVVQKEKACVVGMPVKDTIKLTDSEGYAESTPPRDRLWMIQTPQVFSYPLIRDAYRKLLEQEEELKKKNITITDDAMVLETFTEHKVRLVEGSYQNIKITTPEDLIMAEGFLRLRGSKE